MPTNICVKSFGCSANFAEGEMMKGLLEKADFKMIDDPKKAFLIIMNICTVKGDDQALKEIRDVMAENPHKKIIIAGCIPSHLPKAIKEIVPDATLVNTHNIQDIVSAVEETIHDNPISLLARSKVAKINFPRVRKNPVVGIVPIASGCIGKCAYCSVKFIKGELFSYPPEMIVDEVRKCVLDRCKEIWITAQDTGCYGADIGTNLAELLTKIVEISGDFKIRVGMANPKSVLENIDALIKVFKHPKMFKFLHIPVQSGNDKVLNAMNRPYTVDDFKKIVKKFREEIPEITISTDMICGFPGETEEQFRDSLLLIESIKPDVLNISRFISRPGTKAAEMKEQIPGGETKERSTKMTSTFDWIAFEGNKKWRNWQGDIIIDEVGKDNTFVGRNPAYKPVIVSGNYVLGQAIKVKVTNITKYDLRAEEVINR